MKNVVQVGDSGVGLAVSGTGVGVLAAGGGEPTLNSGVGLVRLARGAMAGSGDKLP